MCDNAYVQEWRECLPDERSVNRHQRTRKRDHQEPQVFYENGFKSVNPKHENNENTRHTTKTNGRKQKEIENHENICTH